MELRYEIDLEWQPDSDTGDRGVATHGAWCWPPSVGMTRRLDDFSLVHADITVPPPPKRGRGTMRSMVEGVLRAPNRTIEQARVLRRQMSLPEVVLWQALRQKRLVGLRIRRQHPVGPYILDFYCPAARLAIEVDGFAHDTAIRARRDERRRAWLSQRGITVLRVRAGDVLRDESLEGVLLEIENTARFDITPSGALCAPPPPRKRRRNPPSAVATI
jgi:very-short-patch-repair endonuclease